MIDNHIKSSSTLSKYKY